MFDLNKYITPILALIIVGGGLPLIAFVPSVKTEIVAILMAVIGFYFGSSTGSRRKDDLIAPPPRDRKE